MDIILTSVGQDGGVMRPGASRGGKLGTSVGDGLVRLTSGYGRARHAPVEGLIHHDKAFFVCDYGQMCVCTVDGMCV